MKAFFGREHELNELQHHTGKKTASLIAITGRLRIGKSRLVEEFAGRNPSYRQVVCSGLAPGPGITPKKQRLEFARQIERQLAMPPIASDDWADLFSHLAANVSSGKWIILLDELSWLGMEDTTFLPKLKNAWDLEFKKNPRLILILCGSVSSWIEKNLLSSTGFVGRISSRLRLRELGAAVCARFFPPSISSPYDRLKTLAVTGGVPRYLEELVPSLDVDQNLGRMCFTPEGILFSEFNQIFSELFAKRFAEYCRVVTHLTTGPDSFSGICKALSLPPNGVTSDRLDDMVTAGFLARDYTWHLATRKISRLSRFRLSDNYIRFYLKCIQPHRHAIEQGRFTSRPISALPGWDAIIGHQFENLVLHNRAFVWRACQLTPDDIIHDGPFVQPKTRRQDGCQIDYLIQTKHGPIYACEIKFKRSKIGLAVAGDIAQKITRLKLPKHASVLPVLIHVGGVTDQLKYSDRFARIVDFTRVFAGDN